MVLDISIHAQVCWLCDICCEGNVAKIFLLVTDVYAMVLQVGLKLEKELRLESFSQEPNIPHPRVSAQAFLREEICVIERRV